LPPYSVLKISRVTENDFEVMGEFSNEEEARNFAAECRTNDCSNEHEYRIEYPPSHADRFDEAKV